MKKFLLTSALVVLSVGSAYAADMAPRPAPPPPAYSWNGLYWGVNIGYSWGQSKNDVTLQVAPGVFGTASASRDVNGVIGGFQSGYNYQFGQWVWGFETDFQASGQKGSEVLQINADPTFLNTDHKLKWFGTSRSRLGVLWTPNTLLYGTFGVAYGQVQEDAIISRGVQSASLTFKDWKAGWTAGAGIETTLGNGWTAKLEYLYVDLGRNREHHRYTGPGYSGGHKPPLHRRHFGGSSPTAR
ncbi:MAG: outer membrane protein [Methyloceanibacter sp.]